MLFLSLFVNERFVAHWLSFIGRSQDWNVERRNKNCATQTDSRSDCLNDKPKG
jgi:hypothetical protein